MGVHKGTGSLWCRQPLEKVTKGLSIRDIAEDLGS